MPKTKYPYEDQPVKLCLCGQEIYLAELPSGKMMPVSLDTNECHFFDCPMAKGFRVKRRIVNNYQRK